MSVTVKSNGSTEKLLTEKEFSAAFVRNGVNHIRLIDSGSHLYLAFCLDAEGNTRKVLDLSGANITYFLQENGQVKQTYWTK
ncbi:hypothetical protein [Faecalibaculum rodentium]|uniref:hypothetical protein n=1 Tax=Faecalibaculum rodentium TaxID=1702221 RepID=UPI0027311B3C|nr:hypothetical protein [Faecalibaculum rodentium]